MSSTYFIISAERPGLELRDNVRRTAQLQLMMEIAGLSFTTVNGYYEGVAETSLLIHPNGHPAEAVRRAIKQAAINFQQDTVLEMNSTGHAWLLASHSDKEQYIGKMTVSKQVDIKKVTGYTSLPNGGYLHLEGENV